MAKTIPQFEEASALSAKDQFLFYSNTKKKTMRVSRDNMLGSPGVAASIPGVSTVDSTAPGLPQNLVLASSSSIRNDGTEDIIITAKITPNADADLEGYSWYILEIDVAPVFSGGVLISGGTSAQTPTYEKSAKNNEGGYAVKVFRAVKANKWYLVKVAAVDKSGNYSSYTATNTQNAYVLTTKDSVPPGPPILHGTNHATNPSTAAIKSVFLRWTNPTDSDLARIDIYRADGPSFTTYNKIGSAYGTAWTDSSSVQGIAYRYKLKAVDYSGNESAFSTVSPDPGGGIDYVQITPGQIDATDVKDFAITATKRWNNTIVLEGDIWYDNKSNPSTILANSIAWNAHYLYYQGIKYSVSAGNIEATTQIPTGTGDKVAYVYATIPGSGTSITYDTYIVTTEGGYPTLSDLQFMIATNVNGAHDLAWNSLANAVIGSAWIQNAAITNAKIKDLSADKITAGTIDSDIITLGESGASQGIIKSSGATSATIGTGFWIQGGNTPVFAIGNLAGAPSMRYSFASGALTVKGTIQANDGFFGNAATNGVTIDNTGLSIVGNNVGAENVRLRANLDWDNSANSGNGGFNAGSGFYLGKAGTSGGSPVYRFFIGNTGSDGLGTGADNLYWNGVGLIINGSLGGNIRSGTGIGSSTDAGHGLTVYSPYGIRKGRGATNADDGVLTFTGGQGNGIYYGSQLDLAGSVLPYGGDGLAGDDGSGSLSLSAGYRVSSSYVGPLDGAIVFRTSRENNSASGATDNHSGAQRFRIELDGTVKVVYTASSSSALDTTAGRVLWGAPNANPGRFIVEGQTNAKDVSIKNGQIFVGTNEIVNTNGVITATGAIIDGTSTINGTLASTVVSNSASVANKLDKTASGQILSGTIEVQSAGGLKIGNITWDQYGVVTPGTYGVAITSNGIVGYKSLGAGISQPSFAISSFDGSATFAGELTAPSGNIAGWDISGNTLAKNDIVIDSAGNIRSGKVNYADANSGFWLGKDANIIKFFIGSASENLKWDGTDLSITGSINANGGDIAGWVINSDNLAKNNTTISSTGFITLGTNTNVVTLSSIDNDYRIWVGDAAAAVAPFRVSKTGVVTANGAVLDSNSTIGGRSGSTISGAINSNGDITTTSFNTSTRQILEAFQFPTDDYDGAIKAGNITWSPSGTINGGSGVVIYRGGIFGATNGAVKFSIDTSGNATFGGQLSAPTGNIGGFQIGTSDIHNGKTSLTDANSGVYVGTDGLALGANSVFKVTNSGVLTATSGTIGGWTIDSNKLYAGSQFSRIALEVDASLGGVSIYAGSEDKNQAPFKVTNSGSITATSGLIGGAYIQLGTITVNGYDINTFQTIYNGISSNLSHPAFFAGAVGPNSPNLNYRNGPFYVNKDGSMVASSATITGAITATSGFIGTAADGFAINSTYIRKGTKTSYGGAGTGVYIGTDGIGLGTTFTVSAAGELTAVSGTIGGWTLAASKLSAGNIEINATSGNEKIQAGPNASNYVKISSAGIVGISSTLGTVFNLPTDGTKPTFSSGEITLTKFTVSTQGIIETSSTAGDGTVNGQGVRINNTGIKGFKASNASPTFYLNVDGTFSLGSVSDANYLTWDGTSLAIKGSITLVNSIPSTSVSGLGLLATQSSVAYGDITGAKPPSNADVTLSAVNGGLTLTGGGLVLSSGGASIRGGQTGYNTGNGFWIGDVSGTTKFSIGQQNGNRMLFDGTDLEIRTNSVYIGMDKETSSGTSVISQIRGPIELFSFSGGSDGWATGSIFCRMANGTQASKLSANAGTNFSINGRGWNASNSTWEDFAKIQFTLINSITTNKQAYMSVYVKDNTNTNRYLEFYDGRLVIDGAYPGNSGGKINIATAGTTASDGIYFYNDVNLYRSAPDVLQTDDDIKVGNNSTQRWIYFPNGGHIEWGASGTYDTNLYRNGANALKTDDDFIALSVTTSSSRKVKTNIKKYKDGLNIVEKLKPVSFNRKSSGKTDIGLIAEDVDKVLPVIVMHNDKNETEGLDYSKLTIILINAVKELSAEVKELKKKLKDANTN